MSRADHQPRDDAPDEGRGARAAPTALEWQAAALALKDAGKFRDALEIGPDQAVDVTLRLQGLVTVCGDQCYHLTKKPKLEEILGVVLLALGPKTRLAAIEAVQTAFAGWDPDEEKKPAPAAIEQTENLLARLQVKVQQTRRGNVTGDVRVTRLASC